jgi:DNA-binding CsgD family transcriptional regulator
MAMNKDVLFIDELSGLLSSATSATDLCRKLVHSKLTESSTTGASLYSIDHQAHFNLVGSYGKGMPVSGISVWDDHPLGNAARQGSLCAASTGAIDGSPAEVYCLPLMKASEPIGVLSFTAMPGSKLTTASDEALSAASKVAGIWLESLGLRSSSSVGLLSKQTSDSPESLTERQVTVLRLMTEGKTNAQIAQELILSESTIRQETVKVYRALGVHSRVEAGKRARHLGIIDRVAI